MHPHTLTVGDVQSLVFLSTNDEPFWISPAEKELNRHDQILPSAPGPSGMQNKSKSELKAELGPFGILNNCQRYRRKEQAIARTCSEQQ